MEVMKNLFDPNLFFKIFNKDLCRLSLIQAQ